MTRLRGRISEIADETKALKNDFKSLQKDQRRLARDKKAIDAQIAASEAKCEDVQMLKFGQIIDLSVLEKAGNAQEENAVQQRLRDLDAAHDDEI